MGFQTVFARDRLLSSTSASEFQTRIGIAPASQFWVSSVTGATTNDGLAPDKALTTITAALALCTASKGDIIYVAADHAETITAAAGIDVNKAGVTIVGMGNGTNRPTIGIGTITTATFKISAANVRIVNFRFRAVTAQLLVKMIDVAAGNFTIEDCWLQAASTATFLVSSFINLNTTFDDFVIRRCQFFQGTDPAGTDGGVDTGAIYVVDSENVLVDSCEFFGNFETALIHNKTTKVQNLWVVNCRGYCALSGSEPFQLVAAASGGTWGGLFITPAETGATETTLVGTIGDVFFISNTTGFGNDGLAGGQGSIIAATAS